MQDKETRSSDKIPLAEAMQSLQKEVEKAVEKNPQFEIENVEAEFRLVAGSGENREVKFYVTPTKSHGLKFTFKPKSTKKNLNEKTKSPLVHPVGREGLKKVVEKVVEGSFPDGKKLFGSIAEDVLEELYLGNLEATNSTYPISALFVSTYIALRDVREHLAQGKVKNTDGTLDAMKLVADIDAMWKKRLVEVGIPQSKSEELIEKYSYDLVEKLDLV